MMRQIRQIFARYADRQTRMTGDSQPLRNADDAYVGQIDTVQLRDGRLVFEGWADGERVSLARDGMQVQVRPNGQRDDVVHTHPDLRNPRPGFTISLPYRAGPVAFAIENGSDLQMFPVPAFDIHKVRRLRRSHVWLFALRLVWAAPVALRYKLCRDPVKGVTLRQRMKTRLGLETETAVNTGAMDSSLLTQETTVTSTPASDAVTIILPIYNAFDLVQQCLDRVVKHTDVPWHLVIIEDCSTDVAVRPWLRAWVARTNIVTPNRVTLIENPENCGFIGSVNSGFKVALTRGDHVVLLNSDALVPANWVSRLLRPLASQINVASVTPMSNDAEIFGAPIMCVPVQLIDGEADTIDAIAASFNDDASLVDAPTGVGFCMAMHIDWLRKYPDFDPSFGRGYGEEVDWCQRVRADGGRHLGLAGLYVEHRGGQSFGNEEKLKLVARNNAVIASRYADYDADVQDFIRHDPLATSRMALALAWAGARAARQGHALPVYMAHALGGGAEDYLQQRIAKDIAGAGQNCADVAVILRVGEAVRWQLEVHGGSGITCGATDDFAFVQRLLASVTRLHLVYSNGVGDRDPVSLPARLLDLKRGDSDTVEILFHDYFPISPSYTLLDQRNHFNGVPPDTLRSLAHETRRPDGTAVKLVDWRAAWGALLAAGDVVVFSDDGMNHVRTAYPDSRPRVVPHKLGYTPECISPPATNARQVVGVLGNIGVQKGAALLEHLGAHVGAKGLVLIGNIDPAFDPGPNVIIHGDYQLKEITTLAVHYGITAWLIPSIWPETFSYTTHECLATGLPVWCFDLGAQAEAVRHATTHGARGGILPLNWADQPAQVVARITQAATT
ncbi:MAG: GT2 family glycosyltransferase [Gammaproteobacteria bacterium]|jgi:GT2 family glycosyltransferase